MALLEEKSRRKLRPSPHSARNREKRIELGDCGKGWCELGLLGTQLSQQNRMLHKVEAAIAGPT